MADKIQRYWVDRHTRTITMQKFKQYVDARIVQNVAGTLNAAF